MKKEVGLNNTYNEIRGILEKARSHAYRAVNFAMVLAYWHIGKIIVEEEQKGEKKAGYGKYLLKNLSERLTKDYGQGFAEASLRNMRQFYLAFGIRSALWSELTWSHYKILMRVENDDARKFYLIETINNRWDTRTLERQIHSLLYERLALSKDKEKIRLLSTKGQTIQKPEDIIKEPYVLDFLGLKENKNHLEKDIESLLLDKLKDFLLELGKGFSFVARQKRISVGDEHYYVDLVFYNYVLKCFVLIDLKSGKLSHQDIGQMDFYVRYFEKEEKQKNDSPTIGLILCSDRNEAMAKYTLLEDRKNIFASKYRLYLPDESVLRKQLENERRSIEAEKMEQQPPQNKEQSA